MKNNFRIALTLIFLSFLAIVGYGLKYLSSLDKDEFKTSFAEKFKKSTGREISFEGPITIKYFPLSLEIENITIANPKNFKTENLLSLKKIQAKFKILPLFFKEIRVDELNLKEGYLTFEVTENAEKNWDFKQETEEGGEENNYDLTLENIAFENISLQYLNDQEKITRKLDIATAKMSSDSMLETNGSLTGRFNDLPITASYTGPRPEYFLSNKKNMAKLGFKVRYDGTTFEMTGQIGPYFEGTKMLSLEMNAILLGGKLSSLNSLFSTDFSDAGPYEISFETKTEKDSVSISNLIAKLKQNEVKGKINVKIDDKFTYDANLVFNDLKLNDFLSLFNKSEESNQVSEDLDLSMLQKVNGQAKLSLKSLGYNDFDVKDLDFTVTQDSKQISFNDIKGGLFKGALSGNGNLSLDDYKLVSKLNLSDVSFKDIFDNGLSTSPTRVDIDLTTTLKNPQKILENLNGDVVLMAQEGMMTENKFSLFERDLLFIFFPKEKDPANANLKLNCLVSDIKIKNGILGTEFLMFDTEHLTVGGVGKVNLITEQFNLMLDPRPKDPKFLSAASPLTISGNFDKYSVMPSASGVFQAGIGIGLTTLAGPLGLLVPLFNTGEAEKNPCEKALKGDYKELAIFKEDNK